MSYLHRLLGNAATAAAADQILLARPVNDIVRGIVKTFHRESVTDARRLPGRSDFKARRLSVAVLVLSALTLPAVTSASDHHRTVTIDVNRPRSLFDCDLPIGIKWYGSTERCLQELCAGQNVFNESIFDGAGRRRKNPCFGQSPSEVPR